MEDRLSPTLADVDDDAVIIDALVACLLGGELADLTETRDVPLGDNQEMRVRAWIDVVNRDEARAGANVITIAIEPAEEAVLRQRGSPPRRPPLRARGRARRPAHRRATASSRRRNRVRAYRSGQRLPRRSSPASAPGTRHRRRTAGGRCDLSSSLREPDRGRRSPSPAAASTETRAPW